MASLRHGRLLLHRLLGRRGLGRCLPVSNQVPAGLERRRGLIQPENRRDHVRYLIFAPAREVWEKMYEMPYKHAVLACTLNHPIINTRNPRVNVGMVRTDGLGEISLLQDGAGEVRVNFWQYFPPTSMRRPHSFGRLRRGNYAHLGLGLGLGLGLVQLLLVHSGFLLRGESPTCPAAETDPPGAFLWAWKMCGAWSQV